MQVDWINMIFTTVTISVTRMTTPPIAHKQLGRAIFSGCFLMLLDVGWWSLGQKSGVGKVHRGKVYQVSFLAAWYRRSTTAFMADTVSITSSKVLSLKEIYSDHMKKTWRRVRLQSFRLDINCRSRAYVLTVVNF